MSVFSASISHRSFYWQISLLCFVLGLLLATAAHTATTITRSGTGATREGFVFGPGPAAAVATPQKLESEISKQRMQITELEDRLAKGTSAASALNQDLQDIKLFAGLTDTVGPGVQVTLTDSKKQAPTLTDPQSLSLLIHDSDIANVVNELKAAGSEAIAVNGQRVVASTAIRCVGPVVHINGIPTAPPFVVQAVGDPDVLYQALNLPRGVLQDIRDFDPNMIKVEKKARLVLPGYAGSTLLRFARTVNQTPRDLYNKER
ncbi:MAG TPA: DUF881 domain-containing protein [Chthonomonadales bacterium]|nr:DUF881 domain-containing protein [Chthonomonadales bacterium]